MVQAVFTNPTLSEPFTVRTAVFTGSSVSNAQVWYLYNERND